jgi:hypothetical protein
MMILLSICVLFYSSLTSRILENMLMALSLLQSPTWVNNIFVSKLWKILLNAIRLTLYFILRHITAFVMKCRIFRKFLKSPLCSTTISKCRLILLR